LPEKNSPTINGQQCDSSNANLAFDPILYPCFDRSFGIIAKLKHGDFDEKRN